MWKRLLISAGILFLSVTSTAANPRLTFLGDNDPDAAKIREAVTSFVRNLADGKYDEVRKSFGGSTDDAKLMELYISACEQCRELQNLAKSKLGDSADLAKLKPLAEIRASVEFYQTNLFVINDNEATMPSVTNSLSGFRLRRQNGMWQITRLVANDEVLILTRDHLAMMMDIEQVVVSRIKSMGVRSFDDFRFILDEIAREHIDKFIASHRYEPKLMKAPTSRSPSPIESGEQFRNLIGKGLRSKDIETLVSKMPGLPTLNVSAAMPSINLPERIVLHSFDSGLNIIFQGSPVTISSIVVFNRDSEEGLTYIGPFPDGLTSSDTRREVEAKIGSPAKSGTANNYFAEYDQLGLKIDYVGGDARDPSNRIESLRITNGNPLVAVGGLAKGPLIAIRPVVQNGSDSDPMMDLSDPQKPLLAVSRELLITEKDINEFSPIRLPKENRTGIYIHLTNQGADRMAKFTKANLGSRLAVVVNGQLLSAPVIRQEISNRISISAGSSTANESLIENFARIHAAIFRLTEK